MVAEARHHHHRGAAALVLVSTAGASGPIISKVRYVFNRAGVHGVMFEEAEPRKRYVKTPEPYVVVCLADGKVLVHADEEHISRAPDGQLVSLVSDRSRLAR